MPAVPNDRADVNRPSAGAHPDRTALGLFVFAWAVPAIVAGWAAYTMVPQAPPLVPGVAMERHQGVARLIFDPWQNWDGQWFLEIARFGYGREGTPAFFPFYPAVVRGMATFFMKDHMLAALVSSWLAFGAALVLLSRQLFRDFGRSRATASLLLLVSFPTALFFHAAYSESLFLLLATATLVMARRGRWLSAGLLGFFAIFTRSAGVALVPALAVEAWAQALSRRQPSRSPAPSWGSFFSREGLGGLRRVPLRAAFGIALPLLALPAILGVYQHALGDPWAFREAQRLWERHPSAPWSALIDGIRVVVPGQPWTLAPLAGGFPRLEHYPGGFLEASVYNLLAALFGIALSVVALRKLPAMYGAYACAGLLVPLTTASQLMPLYSMPRFVVVLFPLFVALALLLERRPLLQALVVATFSAAQGFAVARFALWYWVA